MLDVAAQLNTKKVSRLASAVDCLHLFTALAAGQLPCITRLTPVLLRLHELDKFEAAALVSTKVAALFTGFITDPDGTAGGLSRTKIGSALTVGIEPGSRIPLPPGTDIRFSNPTERDAYSVEDWAETTENGARVLTAVCRTPHSISLAPTPGDPGAHVAWRLR